MNFLIKDYTQLEQTTFKTFLGFSFMIIIFLLPSFYIFSSYYRVTNIDVQGSSYIDKTMFIEFYNVSIWSIGETSFGLDKFGYNLAEGVASGPIVKGNPLVLVLFGGHKPHVGFYSTQVSQPGVLLPSMLRCLHGVVNCGFRRAVFSLLCPLEEMIGRFLFADLYQSRGWSPRSRYARKFFRPSIER